MNISIQKIYFVNHPTKRELHLSNICSINSIATSIILYVSSHLSFQFFIHSFLIDRLTSIQIKMERKSESEKKQGR